MGWKKVKEHYRIEHIVKMSSEGLCIGSGYIPETIVVNAAGEIVTRYDRGNNALERYQREIEADPDLFVRLMAEPDVFERNVPVFSYAGAQVLEKQCEELGWPNVTHDGDMMYENTWFPTREEAIRKAKEDARAGVELWGRHLVRVEDEVKRLQREIDSAAADLAALDAAYPEVVLSDD